MLDAVEKAFRSLPQFTLNQSKKKCIRENASGMLLYLTTAFNARTSAIKGLHCFIESSLQKIRKLRLWVVWPHCYHHSMRALLLYVNIWSTFGIDSYIQWD